MGLPANPDGRLSKVPIATAKDALRVAADAVSVQLSFEFPDLDDGLRDVSKLVTKAHSFSLPVLIMINEGPPGIKPCHDVADKVKICAQLDVDLIKVALPHGWGDSESVRRLKTVLPHCPPILLAGGAQSPEFEATLQTAARIGFGGVCIGRNIFQSSEPRRVLEMIDAQFSAR